MNTPEAEFGKWRSFFWPIRAYELKKVLPLFLLFFLITFVYCILRNTKDTLIVTAPGSGVEAILFIKFWLVLPSAILFAIIYAKLSNILTRQALFYATVIPFLLFYALFTFVLFPNRDVLHPTEAADRLQALLPEGFAGFVALFRNWTYALFAIVAELWSSFMISLIFWGFANEITKVGEAKRFYSLFGIGANVALLVAGALTVVVADMRATWAPDEAWTRSLFLLMGLVLLAGVGIIATYWWINRYVLTDSRFFTYAEQSVKKRDKPKMSLKESFFYLAKSPYVGLLALLVICYGVSINIVEVTWKNQLKLQYPNANDYSAYLGYFATATGAATIFMMLFVGGNVIRRFGWGVGALVTPVVLLLTGVAFVVLILFQDNLSGLFAAFGTTPLVLAVFIGAVQNIMSKSSKYALFDPTKEMAYIPLDQEQKVKGKAAVDVVGSRLGKSGGSLIQQGLVITLGSIGAITPYLGVILIVFIAIWIIAARALNSRFIALTTQQVESATLSQQPEL